MGFLLPRLSLSVAKSSCELATPSGSSWDSFLLVYGRSWCSLFRTRWSHNVLDNQPEGWESRKTESVFCSGVSLFSAFLCFECSQHLVTMKQLGAKILVYKDQDHFVLWRRALTGVCGRGLVCFVWFQTLINFLTSGGSRLLTYSSLKDFLISNLTFPLTRFLVHVLWDFIFLSVHIFLVITVALFESHVLVQL